MKPKVPEKSQWVTVPEPGVVLVGGGPGQADQMSDGPLRAWLPSVDQPSTWMTSVCTGSLILAAAGRRATGVPWSSSPSSV